MPIWVVNDPGQVADDNHCYDYAVALVDDWLLPPPLGSIAVKATLIVNWFTAITACDSIL